MTTEEFRATLDRIEAQYERWKAGELSGAVMPVIRRIVIDARAKLDAEAVENCR